MKKIIRIGIFGSDTNAVKLAKILSKNLQSESSAIIELLLPESCKLFNHNETTILESISNNELGIFENNDNIITNFMDEHKNVRVFKNCKIVEYYELNKKHVLKMYVEAETNSASKREYDYFVFADKMFTIASAFKGISSDHSLVNVASIHETDKIEWLFTKTRYWLDAESIVLIGNNLRTYNFAIDLRETFPDLKITIINDNWSHSIKPLKGYVFDRVADSLIRKMRSMEIEIYLNADVVRKGIDHDTDLISWVEIKDLDSAEVIKIDTEIVLIVDNYRKDNLELSNSYFINKVFKANKKWIYPFLEIDENYQAENFDNLYFITPLFYKINNLKNFTFEQQKRYTHWYPIEYSHTHAVSIASSILEKISKTKSFIPVNVDILENDNTKVDVVGIETENVDDITFFTMVGNNFSIIKHNMKFVKIASLRRGDASINIALFYDIETGLVRNFLLETKIFGFKKNDARLIKNIKKENIEKIHFEISEILQSFKVGNVNVLDILIKFIDIFGKKYIYRFSSIIYKTRLEMQNAKATKMSDEDIELNVRNLNAFKFELNETFEEEKTFKTVKGGD